jgi:putative SOS response-associated peptidase YedK
MVFTNEKPDEPQAFVWGLIPSWVKSAVDAKKFYNQTLNARGETIFEKPSFKTPAKSKRCLVYIDGFYEFYHAGGKTYPFHIVMKDDSPMALAGLYDEWVNKETGEIVHSVTLVTTKANETMSRIHNNPKADEARMPVILPKEKQNEWLAPIHSDEDRKRIEALIVPFDDSQLKYYTVRPLKGKNAVGDTPEALEEFEYPELALLF